MLAVVAIAAAAPAALSGQAPPAPQRMAVPLSWTDWADLVLASPVILSGTIADIARPPASDRTAPAAGQGRVLVRMGLTAALQAPGLLPAEAAWLWDGPVNARGRPPFARNEAVLVFGTPLSGGGNPAVQPLRLSGPNGQQPWSADAEAGVRDILRQAQAPGARGLLVTGLRDGFRTEGDVPGTSESQFFLTTQSGGSLALVVRRAPGRDTETLVATGDLVDRAQAVAPRTLLWRGLACGMPPVLPPGLAADAGLAADYAEARGSLGDCGRTLEPPG
jgi:hypothetical protein